MSCVNEEIRTALMGVSLFSELDEETLSALAQIAYIKHVAAGETIFRQGDPGEDMLVLLHGSIQATARTAGGNEITLGVMGPGEFFGEMSLLDGFPRSATVRTLQDSDLVVVDRETFTTLLKHQSQLAVTMLRSLARRFRRMNDNLADIATLDVHQRVARRLLLLASSHGKPADRGIRITVPMRADILAGLLASTTDIVQKVLEQLQREGMVALGDDGFITVLEPERLSRLRPAG